MEKKEFAFENEYIKIINPSREMEKEIADILKENSSKGISGTVSLYQILNKLAIPIDDMYDFSKYSIDEFIEMTKEPHYYDGFIDILNVIQLIGNNATYHELQYIALGLRQQKIELLLNLIRSESQGIGDLAKEVFVAQKEEEKMSRLASEYERCRKIRHEIEEKYPNGDDN